jgi:alpha-amylase
MMQEVFKQPDWMSGTNIYEVNLRQYTPEGTIKAFMKHLPRLHDMGVDVVWFMPVTPISHKNRKGTLGSYYACSSYVDVNPEFGTLNEFKEMVRTIQSMGMKVIIDWVANHTGWDHEWTKTNPDFYTKNEHGHFKPPVESWEDVIHLNYMNGDLWKAMIAAMEFWVTECDIDGFRCDMAALVPLDFWAAARRHIDRHKTLFWLGEFDQWGEEAFGNVFDASYTWHWMHVAQEFYRHKWKLGSLDAALTGYQHKKPHRHLRTFFTTNHDENSWNGTEYEKYGQMALPLAVFSCLWKGIPLLYSGQEQPNHKRLLFFDKDLIEWKGKPALHEFYKRLLSFRKTHPVFQNHPHKVITWRIGTSQHNNVFSFVRTDLTHSVIVLLNFSEHRVRFRIEDTRLKGEYKDLYTDRPVSLKDIHGLDPWGYMVLYS